MKIKALLRFYFSAESLERAFDRIILHNACASWEGNFSAADDVDKLCRIIGEKMLLGELWRYLNKIISPFTERDKSSLKEYSAMRTGIKRLDYVKRNAIKSAAVKFTRHANRLERFSGSIKILGKYYCLLVP